MAAREPLRGAPSDGTAAPLSARLAVLSPVNSFQSSVEGLVAPVLRRLTSQETYYCQICLCNCPASDGFQLSSCNHLFCSHCLRSYVDTRLAEAALYGLLCPFLPDFHGEGGLSAGCATEIPDEEVQRLCGEETLAQLQRFRAMRQDETYRECPSCQARVLGGGPGRRQRTLTCPQCSLVFCFKHANAHPGQSCWQFEMTQRLTQLKAAVHMATVSRRCPSCSMKIIKDGGCNHMTCAFCGADFCWLCGRHLTGESAVQRHYAREPGSMSHLLPDALHVFLADLGSMSSPFDHLVDTDALAPLACALASLLCADDALVFLFLFLALLGLPPVLFPRKGFSGLLEFRLPATLRLRLL